MPKEVDKFERMIQTLKQMLSKCARGKQDWKQALLQFRGTPLSNSLPSHAKILCQHPLRTLSGQAPTQLIGFQDVKTKLIERQNPEIH